MVSKGVLELGSMTEREHEALLSKFAEFEISLMDDDHRYCDQSFAAEIAGSSSLEGATTMAERLSVQCQRESASEFEM